jgi:transcriptional regulator with XRE-family HTH domain
MIMSSIVKRKAKEKGIKISLLAEFLGVSKQTLYNKLSGKSEFTASELNKLKTILELTEDEIQKLLEEGCR